MRAASAVTAHVTPPADDPAAIPLEYVPIPAGPNGSLLLAHDRHRLMQIVARALVPARTLRVAELPYDTSVVEQVEFKAIRRARRLRRKARARQWAHVIAAAGLPFLVASLLGLVSLAIRPVPMLGGPVADFIGSAGGSLGGLPLAAIISLVPSAWLIRRAGRAVATRPAARGTEDTLEVAPLQVREDSGPFLAAADVLLTDIGDLMSGRSRIDGQRALRLATRFDRLKQLAAQYELASVHAFAGDMAAQFRLAGRPPRRLIPGLYARRSSIPTASAIAPYDPSGRTGLPEIVSIPATLLLGALGALVAFFAAGVFRLSADDALVLVPNEALAFPSSAGAFALGKGFDGPTNPGLDTLGVIQGPGLFWTWPQPIAERWTINLASRTAPVTTIFRTEAEAEDLRVQFRFDVTDLTSFIRLGPSELADQFVASILERSLGQFLLIQRDALVAESGESSDNINELLRLNMQELLNQFVEILNAEEQLTGLGILLQPEPSFSFRQI